MDLSGRGGVAGALEVMLMQSNDLAVAYYLKEQFYDFTESKNRDETYGKLRKF